MAQAISESMLRSWMDRLGPRLITLSAGICRDRHQAEEIVQEAFVKLWRSPPDAGEIAFTSWPPMSTMVRTPGSQWCAPMP